MKDSSDSEILLTIMNELKYKKVGNAWKSYAVVVKPIVPTVSSAAEERKLTGVMVNKKFTGLTQCPKPVVAKQATQQSEAMIVD